MYELTGISKDQPRDEKPRRVLIARADNETEAERIRREERERYVEIRQVRIG